MLEIWFFVMNLPINSLARHEFEYTLVNLKKFPSGFALGKFFQTPSGIFKFPPGSGNLSANTLQKTKFLPQITFWREY